MRRLALLLCSGCGAVYKDTALIETNWYGRVTTVQGGKVTPAALPWTTQVSGLLGSVSWLLVAATVVLIVLAWKFPGWWKKHRESQAARGRLKEVVR